MDIVNAKKVKKFLLAKDGLVAVFEDRTCEVQLVRGDGIGWSPSWYPLMKVPARIIAETCPYVNAFVEWSLFEGEADPDGNVPVPYLSYSPLRKDTSSTSEELVSFWAKWGTPDWKDIERYLIAD